MLSIDDSHWDTIPQSNALHNDFPNNDYIIGTIHSKCSPLQIIQKCTTKLQLMFKEQHNLVPSTIKISGNQSVSFPYIPDHLEYILFSILKNAM